ncbi:hypothetical protein CEXT_502031 [Caerostris extrusa]|uniref:Protein kinase C-terminal domain-containing protein n=1 Tax=Caerostris extrusa TaxID=172846 RepID=A0AAV4MUJ1_CAEEX|nr:hypothetical protein CEXT_502031 [Caerostris extrusa]
MFASENGSNQITLKCNRNDKTSSWAQQPQEPLARRREFRQAFTTSKPDLTPADKVVIMNIDQSEFADFSYFNPEFIAHV